MTSTDSLGKPANEDELAHFLALPYAARQIIAVSFDPEQTAVQQLREENPSGAAANKIGANFAGQGAVTATRLALPSTLIGGSTVGSAAGAIMGSALGPVGFLVGLGVGVVAGVLKSSVTTEQQPSSRVVTIPHSLASLMLFPPGHPQERIVYVAHPVDPRSYCTAARFHRFTFEHKLSEAVSLLMALGAAALNVEQVAGWGHEFSSSINVGLAKFLGADGSCSQISGSRLLYKASLASQHAPFVPADLVWFKHEPTWQVIASGRMQYGLEEFDLAIEYEDDFGINASLAAGIRALGLELGGQFQDHTKTVWRIWGRF